MSLIETRITMDGIVTVNKIELAIKRLQFAYKMAKNQGLEKLYICFSGGKDSIVLARLAEMSGVPYDLNYNITGIDPPELVYFMRDFYPLLKIHKYEKSMFRLIVEKKFPPTRLIRYCCSELKEKGGFGEICCTGVRWAESVKRRGRKAFEIFALKKADRMLFNDNELDRRLFEQCVIKSKFVVNPLIDFTDSDIWEFIHLEKLQYCKLYDFGFKRLGCIGCPLASIKMREYGFERYPKFKQYYLGAFSAMLKNKPNEIFWKTPEDVFKWWLYGNEKTKERQIKLILQEIE